MKMSQRLGQVINSEVFLPSGNFICIINFNRLNAKRYGG